MPPRTRRRWRCPRRDFSRHGSAPATSAPAAWRLAHTAAPPRSSGRMRVVHRQAGAHQRLVVEVARAEARRARAGGRPPAGRRPSRVRAPCESSSMPPAAKPPVASTTASAGSARVRAASRTRTPVTRPPAALHAHGRAGPAAGSPPAARSGRRAAASAAACPAPTGGRVGISDHRRAQPLLQVVPRLAGRVQARPPPAAPRSRRARSAGAARRRARARRAGSSRPRACTGPATSARPGRADHGDLERPRLHAGSVGQAGARQVVGQERAGRSPSASAARRPRTARRRARSPRGDRRRAPAPWAGPRRRRVGSSRLRPRVALVAQARRPARGTTRAPRRAARGRGAA